MTSLSKRTERAMEIFDQACDLSGEQRNRVLSDACGDDAALRAEVESLLLYDQDAGDAIKAAEAGEGIEALIEGTESTSVALPEKIGGYRIIRKIGEGGMGEVFEAEQESPRRRVALKLIQAGRVTPSLVKRFEREAFVLGQLQHPGIAAIHESGMVEVDGRQQPFFAMELIEGENITAYAKSQSLSVRQRLELMARVCDALQHAHQKSVIHRDLKPPNILVIERGTEHGTKSGASGTGTTIDVVGQPKVLDFGVARITSDDMQAMTFQTEVGQIIGTLNYMSPEQVEGDSSDLDARCDVYALGVILFQLLTDRLPVDISGKSVAESARIICDDEPILAGTLDRDLRGDVETILAKCLEKEPDRRYQSAAEVAADLRRYLQDEPITARHASAIYQLRKFARRNKGLVGGLVATFIVLVIGLISTGYYLIEARAQRDDAIAARDESDAVTKFQTNMLRSVNMEKMGLWILSTQRETMRNALEKKKISSQEVESKVAVLDELQGYINPTDLAKRLYDDNVLTPAAEGLEVELDDQSAVAARIHYDLGSTYYNLGLREKAVAHMERSLELRRQLFGNHDRCTISSMGTLCTILATLKRLEDATPICEEAIEVTRTVWGAEHHYTLLAMKRWAVALFNSRLNPNRKEAVKLLRTVVEIRRRADPVDELNLYNELMFLAEALNRAGKYDEVEPIIREAMEGLRRTAGNRDTNTLTAMEVYSQFLLFQGRAAEILPLAKEAMDACREIRGTEHVSTLSIIRVYARALDRVGQHEQATEYWHELIEIWTRLRGPDHPKLLFLNDQLARSFMAMGRLEEAEQLARSIWTSRRRNAGKRDDAKVIDAQMFLAHVLVVRGAFAEAEQLMAEVLKFCDEMPDDDSNKPWRPAYASNLRGSALAGLGRFAEAEPLIVESYQALQEVDVQGSLRWNIFQRADKSVVELYEAWGKPEEAAKWRAKTESVQVSKP